jgi:hypothetical protein
MWLRMKSYYLHLRTCSLMKIIVLLVVVNESGLFLFIGFIAQLPK